MALAAAAPPAAARTIRGDVVWVSDGDTVIVRAGGDEFDVRLLGIDTPETKKPGVAVECGGREATSRMWRLTFTAPYDGDGDGRLDRPGGMGRRIVLRTDPTQLRYDRFGRLLAYATVGGRSLQERMIASGWATTYLLGWTPFRKRDRFLALEKGAQRAGRGVYGKCGGDFHSRQ